MATWKRERVLHEDCPAGQGASSGTLQRDANAGTGEDVRRACGAPRKGAFRVGVESNIQGPG